MITHKDIKDLVKMEQDMDSGIQPFVKWERERIAVTQESMDHFGFIPGQTITDVIAKAYFERRLEISLAEIAKRDAHALAQSTHAEPQKSHDV